MAFPDEVPTSLQEPLEIGGDGFDIVSFTYERTAGDRSSIEITWQSKRTGERVTYRFRSVAEHERLPLFSTGAVVVENLQERQWETPRRFWVSQKRDGGIAFYAGAIERVVK